MVVAFWAEGRDPTMGVRLVCIRSRKEARVWGGGRVSWEKSVPPGKQLYRVGVGHCEDLGFYSKGNEEPSEIFGQRGACG